MISEKQLIQDIKEFLGKKGIDYLQKYKDKGEFCLPWGSVLYGAVGMQVRNYLRGKYPEIDKEFPDYSNFEDYSTNLVLKILK